MISLKAQSALAAALCLAGVASLARVEPLADFSYPLLAWGLVLAADAWNYHRNRVSLWRDGQGKRFLLVTIPLSVLYWLLFEALNLPAPQWRYRGGLESVEAQSLFGFVAFATVIPIVVESCWLVWPSFGLPESLLAWARRAKLVLILAGCALMALPWVNSIFWFNQGMWIAPALIVLPFSGAPVARTLGTIPRGLLAAGLLSGLAWESMNHLAQTRWEYLILPEAPRLFAMPMPGYLGFIPFAAGTIVIFHWQLRLKPSLPLALALYSLACITIYLLTLLYSERGLWILV